MRHDIIDVNHIRLHGCVGARPVESHSNHGVDFLVFPLVVCRLSGVEDRVNVVLSRLTLEQCGGLQEGEEITVQGEVRTFNNRSGQGSRLIISVFARSVWQERREDENHLELSGTLCKGPVLRATPLGRTICDMILAVNRRYGRADYLPCIAWGSLAHRCAERGVGERISLTGRLQSRIYQNLMEEEVQERVAFEVSVMSLMGEELTGVSGICAVGRTPVYAADSL